MNSENECPECGFPLDCFQLSTCPKCDGGELHHHLRGVLEVDIAHCGETWELAREKIADALDQALSKQYRGLKIIHGYGSTTGRSIIGPRAVAYLRHLAEQFGGRYAPDWQNRGASLIWLNR